MTTIDSSQEAEQLTLRGRVQGVGIRPAVARLAESLRLAGAVRNSDDGVEIDIQGPAEALATFRRLLPTSLPDAAKLTEIRRYRARPVQRSSFEIEKSSLSGNQAAHVPQDRGVCDLCLADASGRDRRRLDDSFTSCTSCGPRYSIIESMPFDRANTSMAAFTRCVDCEREYRAIADRRHHAQTISCPRCGPRLRATDADGVDLGTGTDALGVAVGALRRGKIVALRGVGGYQLLADAANDTAVERLRRRKGRRHKPFAVLVATLAVARQIGEFDDVECRLLLDPANPIVLIRRRATSMLSDNVAHDLDTVGVMLPGTPLHWQLSGRHGGPLVCTSGNHEGAPLAYESETSRQSLAEIADVWLEHDRAILRPIDDSVVRVVAGRPVSMRLARGLAPLPLEVSTCATVLAVGGHQKAAIALANGAQAVLGPHFGDLENLATRQRFIEQSSALTQLYGMTPALIVHDMHPDYFTTRWAAEQNLPALAVQHHHAHAAAAMLENGWLDRKVLAVTWDGAGYGPDATIWGGEFLLATACSFRRVARVRPFRLPGGEACVREPWRVAVSVLSDLGDAQFVASALPAISRAQIEATVRLVQRRRLSPFCTSAGRLFDAVASIILGRHASGFEGHPAMLLEAACDSSFAGSYPLPLIDGPTIELDWRPTIAELLNERSHGVPPAAMAARFHRALANAVVDVARRFNSHPVVLGGGVFQNRMLVESIAERWTRNLGPLGLPGRIPPGDGGLAAGQLAVAISRTDRGEQ